MVRCIKIGNWIRAGNETLSPRLFLRISHVIIILTAPFSFQRKFLNFFTTNVIILTKNKS